jgi:hypothetical protein
MVLTFLQNPTQVVVEAETCCPRVVQQRTESLTAGDFSYWLTIVMAALAIVAAILLLVGRFAWASGLLAIAAPLAFFTPSGFDIAGLAFLASLIWALWFLRRAAGRVSAPTQPQ